MKTPTGLINQKIEIYSDQDVSNDSGGVDPVQALYWATSARVEQLGASRNIHANQEFTNPTIRFTIRDRIDKNVLPNMMVKYRGAWFMITSAIPDLVYNQELVITGVSSNTPERPLPIDELFIEWGYSDIEADPVTFEYQFDLKILPDLLSVALPYTLGASNNILLLKVPSVIPIFNRYTINQFDAGNIPNVKWNEPITQGGFTYYTTKSNMYFTADSNTITFTRNV